MPFNTSKSYFILIILLISFLKIAPTGTAQENSSDFSLQIVSTNNPYQIDQFLRSNEVAELDISSRVNSIEVDIDGSPLVLFHGFSQNIDDGNQEFYYIQYEDRLHHLIFGNDNTTLELEQNSDFSLLIYRDSQNLSAEEMVSYQYSILLNDMEYIINYLEESFDPNFNVLVDENDRYTGIIWDGEISVTLDTSVNITADNQGLSGNLNINGVLYPLLNRLSIHHEVRVSESSAPEVDTVKLTGAFVGIIGTRVIHTYEIVNERTSLNDSILMFDILIAHIDEDGRTVKVVMAIPFSNLLLRHWGQEGRIDPSFPEQFLAKAIPGNLISLNFNRVLNWGAHDEFVINFNLESLEPQFQQSVGIMSEELGEPEMVNIAIEDQFSNSVAYYYLGTAYLVTLSSRDGLVTD